MITNAFSQIDLSRLAAPDVVEALDFEAILAEMLADLRGRDSAFTALTEADPAYKILEVAAYRELLIRQRINEAARSVMLAYAAGADLDQIAANFGVARLLIRPADDRTIPPTPAVYETDEELRNRVTLSLEGYTAAGSRGSYVYHALSRRREGCSRRQPHARHRQCGRAHPYRHGWRRRQRGHAPGCRQCTQRRGGPAAVRHRRCAAGADR